MLILKTFRNILKISNDIKKNFQEHRKNVQKYPENAFIKVFETYITYTKNIQIKHKIT